ncbi:alpha/beta-hydrolase [Dacryopinax primogenitus]|uniref:Alpha/beta-hydrolase n=1 Tax=Dacryopinax primogenitus (strain DJM 731) TaxID=1858805 RepID=M5G5J4_DACPD|nr:alpha/beta-hydrolase [Dacryopinax primogenitus]EJU03969.1 alpha/beta-hydrolase [Dacryopinax primogenitus]
MSLLLHILQPAIFPPAFASNAFPLNGPFAFFIRIVRLFYSLLVLPLAIISAFLPTSVTGMNHASWNFAQTLLLRLSSQLLWAIGYGIPPRFVNRDRPTIPTRPRSVVIPNTTDISSCSMTVPPSNSRYRKGILADEELTTPTEIKCYWTSAGKCSDEQLTRQPQEGEKIIVYLVGGERAAVFQDPLLTLVPGGYLTGEPLKFPLPWTLAQKTNLRVMSVSYRKANTDPSNAFPAALHDVVSAWSHLISVGFHAENIFISGDSAGAGLAVTFALYLCLCHLPRPAGLILYSPWLDLTLSHPAVSDNHRHDQLTSDLIQTGARVYTQNFPLVYTDPAMLDAYRFNDAEYLLSTHSFDKLGPRHPLLSPALLSARSPLIPSLSETRFFISYGSVERFAGEIEMFVTILKNGGVEVVIDVEEGGWHNSTADAIGGKQVAVERAAQKVFEFVCPETQSSTV